MRKAYVLLLLLVLTNCAVKEKQKGNPLLPVNKAAQDSIVEKYVKKGAWKYPIFAPEWQLYLDSAIRRDSTIAYLYQQKSMPLFKQGKYEIAMPILDTAVLLDSLNWIDYRAFMKCIFVKSYRSALQDFALSKKLKGIHGYVMDHSYDFYIGLCHLQLNEFDKAFPYFNACVEYTKNKDAIKWVNHLDLFYAGVTQEEMKHHSEAIEYFDLALTNYPGFSDAEFYKALSLMRSDNGTAATDWFLQSLKDFDAGRKFNEGNSKYEPYPYQVNELHMNLIRPVLKKGQ